MPQVEPAIETFARIIVAGVGGAGGAAINRMVEAGVTGVEFVAINTDAQALHHSKAQKKVNIGKETTHGLGVGADPELGQKAAQESESEIQEAVKAAELVFVTFGAGGGTGSGAGHIVAKQAQDAGALVVGFATKPFAFEGEKRRRNAELAIEKLRQHVDTLITIPNDKLLQTIDRRTPLLEAFKVADDVLRQGVQGISDLITVHGLVNLDFADVKTIMSNAGSALMGIGRASGENRAIEAAQQAISSPLLEVSIDGARGILFNVIGGQDMSMHEINTVAETITSAADPEANVIFGATIDPGLEGELIVTVIATGFDESYYATRDKQTAKLLKRAKEPEQPLPKASQVDEATMADLDMDLKEKAEEEAHEFNRDETPNIWALPDEDSPKDETEDKDELDKPSFLRRLTRRRAKEEAGVPEPADDTSVSTDDSNLPGDDSGLPALDDDLEIKEDEDLPKDKPKERKKDNQKDKA